MSDKKIFLLSVAGVILFFSVAFFSGLSNVDAGLAWVKGSFEWITTYGLPWVIVVLLILILKKLNRK